MALFQLNRTLSKVTDVLRKCFSSKESHAGRGRQKPRRLCIDPLEERQMLSVSTGMPTELTINEFDPRATGQDGNGNEYQTTITTTGTESMAGAENGDFVVTWTQEEPIWVRDSEGNLHVDSNNRYVAYQDQDGNALYESNIYARYFTDEVQRLVLPSSLFDSDKTPSGSKEVGEFVLRYGGNEKQRLSFFTATDSNYESGRTNISGLVVLYGIETGDPNKTSFEFFYDESKGPQANANELQNELRNSGPFLENVVVTAINAREFEIEFCDSHWDNHDVPELQIRWNETKLDGFLAGCIVTTTNEPVDIMFSVDLFEDGKLKPNQNIGVTIYKNPEDTAKMLERAFAANSSSVVTAPINYDAWATSAIDGLQIINDSDSISSLNYDTYTLPEVRVVPVYGATDENGNPLPDGTVFDIMFVNGSGKTDHPELKIVSVTDVQKNEYVEQDEDGDSLFVYKRYSSDGGLTPVTTLKEPSATFRVNASETFNEVTQTGVTKQSHAVVSMDADGEFVIAWQSEAKESDTSNPFNEYDIYARRFTVQSIVSSDVYDAKVNDDSKVVQGVRAFGGEFKVNQYSNGPQVTPSISMDNEGNFLIAWSTSAQDSSYFAAIYAAWYDRDGKAITGEFMVTQEATNMPSDPVVAVSPDGRGLIYWQIGNTMYESVYEKFGTVAQSQTGRAGASNPSVAFDTNERYVLSYQRYNGGIIDTNVYAGMYQLTDGGVNEVRGEFRVNSTDYGNGSNYGEWTKTQEAPSVGIDADGDFVISYNGFGPDMGGTFYIDQNAFAPYINNDKNRELIAYLDFFNTAYWNVDADTFTRDFISYAQKNGASDSELAQLNAVIQYVVRNFRGGANDVMYSRYDADTPGTSDYLASDSILNNYRDGNNSSFLISIPNNERYASGTVNLRVNGTQLSFDLALTNNYLNVGNTLNNIVNAFNAQYGISTREGTQVRVRTVNLSEYIGTEWEDYMTYFYGDLNSHVIYEVVLIGDLHDSAYTVDYDYNSNGGNFVFIRQNAEGNDENVTRNVTLHSNLLMQQYGTSGTPQYNSSTTMTPEGSIVTTWTEDVYFTNGQGNGSYLRYRIFTESTDTAGPRVTDVILPSGQGLSDGGLVTYGLKNLVVTFNEELMTGMDPHSVNDVSNWVLLKDGVVVPNAIESIDFGMNYSRWLVTGDSTEGVRNGTLDLGTNKWEAVITFTDILENGTYTIVAKNSIRDRAENPLNRTGQEVNGWNFMRSFEISQLNGILSFTKVEGTSSGSTNEHLVNQYDSINGLDYTLGNQFTRWENGYDDPKNEYVTANQYPLSTPSNPDSVASDALGNFVVVWTHTGSEDVAPGIYAQKYLMAYRDPDGDPSDPPVFEPQDGYEQYEIPLGIFQVFEFTNDTVANQASVAMDGLGNFIVTWTEYTDKVGTVKYMSYSDSDNAADIGGVKQNFSTARTLGADILGVSNSRNSSVAMDSDGDYVFVWETTNNQTKRTEIYGQRFNPDHTPIGGQNARITMVFFESSKLTLGETFTIKLTGPDGSGIETGPITYSQDIGVLAKNVQEELNMTLKKSLKNILDPDNDDPDYAQYPDCVSVRYTTGTLELEFLGEYYGNREIGGVSAASTKPLKDAGIQISCIPDNPGSGGAFLVSEGSTTANNVDPSVGMGSEGHIVVTWTVYDSKKSIYAKVYASNHEYRNNEIPEVDSWDQFMVNTYQEGDKLWSDVGVAADGSFVITWTSYGQDGVGDGPGSGGNGLGSIYAQRYNADREAVGEEIHVNMNLPDEQTHSKIAMAPNGDFIISWESKQDLIDGELSYGVYARRFINTAAMANWTEDDRFIDGYGIVNADGAIGYEYQVNQTLQNDQKAVGVAVNYNCDPVFVWDGYGIKTHATDSEKATYEDQGVFYRRFPNQLDRNPPTIISVASAVYDSVNDSYKLVTINDRSSVQDSFDLMLITVSEWLFNEGNNGDPRSILNPNNWVLSRDGIEIKNAIFPVSYGRDAGAGEFYELKTTKDGKIEVVISIRTPLENGTYTLTIKDNVTDMAGNKLDGDGDSVAGGDFVITFTIGGGGSGDPGDYTSGETDIVNNIDDADPEDLYYKGDQYFRDSSSSRNILDSLTYYGEANPTSVASDGHGNFAVVWTSKDKDTGQTSVWLRKYNVDGEIVDDSLGIIEVSNDNNNAHQASVAMDGAGNIVVTWAEGKPGSQNIFYKYFYQAGDELVDMFGDNPVLVNSNSTTGNNQNPTVAMDADGDFVIAWENCAVPGSNAGWDIYAQRFTSNLVSLGGQNEIQTISFVGGTPSGGSFDLTFKTFNAKDNTWNEDTITVPYSSNLNSMASFISNELEDRYGISVLAQEYNSKIQIIYTGSNYGNIDIPEVIVSSHLTSDSGSIPRAVSDTVRDGVSSVFLVSGASVDDAEETRMDGDQRYPAIGMSAGGEFIITWTGIGELISTEGGSSGLVYESNIYARQYVSNEDFADQDPGDVFQITERDPDEETLNDYTWSSVAMDMDGTFVVTWTVYDRTTKMAVGIQAQRYLADGTPLGAFDVNQSSGTMQQAYSKISMDGSGNFVISFESFQDRLEGSSVPSSYGVYHRIYVGTNALQNAVQPPGAANLYVYGIGEVGPNGERSNELRVNETIEGDQRAGSVAMNTNGDYIIVWQGYGKIEDNGNVNSFEESDIFYRRYTYNGIDLSAPFVTGVSAYEKEDPAVSPLSQRVKEGDSIDFNPQSINVYFSEEMYAGLITQNDSWALYYNGENVRSNYLERVEYKGLDAGTGQVCATLIFSQPLPNGEYQLVASDRLTDLSQNNRLDGDYDGMAGGNFTISFMVNGDGGGEPEDHTSGNTHIVNNNGIDPEYYLDQQYFRGSNPNVYTTDNLPYYGEANPTSVASDGHGNFAVVWTSYQNGQESVWLRKYIINGDDAEETIKIERVSSENSKNAHQASVAMDGAGNIVVTWAEGENGAQNIFYRYYYAQTTEDDTLTKTDPMLVNSTTSGNQQNPAVAMDANGDFVIVWESCAIPGSNEGWDIYAQRYNANQVTLGGLNEIQTIRFEGKPNKGEEFTLTFMEFDLANSNWVSKDLELKYSSNLSVMAVQINSWLKENQISAVAQVFNSSIQIRFTGSIYGNRDIPEIYVSDNFDITSGNRVVVDTIQDGVSSQFLVSGAGVEIVNPDPADPENPNPAPAPAVEETPQVGDQRYPAIGMSAGGEFIITWTGIGELIPYDGMTTGLPYESNIYGRIYASNENFAEQTPSEIFQITERTDIGGGEGEDGENEDEDGETPAPAADGDIQVDYTWSSVAMDMDGTFVVTWTVYDRTTKKAVGIQAQRYLADGTPLGAFDVNQSSGTMQQAYSKISMDGSGNFVITYESFQDRQSGSYTPSSYGVYHRIYVGTGALQNAIQRPGDTNYYVNGIGTVGPNGERSNELRVNETLENDQLAASVAMSANGDYVIVWQGYGEIDDNGNINSFDASDIFYRRYTNNGNDLSAPYVTGVKAHNKTTSSASSLSQNIIQGETLAFNPQSIDVYFSEEMYKELITRNDSWGIFRDGVSVRSSYLIRVDYHGIDELTGQVYATLVFNRALPNGEYEFILYDRVTDLSRNNKLDGDYDGQSGGNYVLNFTIKGNLNEDATDLTFNEDDRIVNDTPATLPEDQYTRDMSDADNDNSSTPRSVASDAEGNFFVVWTSDDANAPGIYGRKYRIDENGNEYSFTEPMLLVSTTDTGYLKQPSVAMDADGDIIVTWAQYTDDISQFDVYYKYLVEITTDSFSGLMSKDLTTGEAYPVSSDITAVRANDVTEGDQQNPRVAMDAEGDFVIVWESDTGYGSGWDIIGQRFAPNGLAVNSTVEVQSIIFEGQPTSGSFTIGDLDKIMKLIDPTYTGPGETRPIQISRNPNATLENVKMALEAFGFTVRTKPYGSTEQYYDCDIVLMSNGADQIQIEFMASEFRMNDVDQIKISNVSGLDNPRNQRVYSATQINWSSGNFLVNDTVEGDQRYPDVAMNLTGEFVVTWTGWSLIDGTLDEYEANIYAKQFASSHALRDYLENPKQTTDPSDTYPLVYTGDPTENHVVSPGVGLDGIVLIDQIWDGFSGSGALLDTGMHILTAAHVVCDDTGNAYAPDAFMVYFDLPSGRVGIPVAEIIVHPSYDGDTETTTDLAIIRLAQMAPSEADRYSLYTGTDELGKEFFGAGYGLVGQVGDPNAPYPTNQKHWYQNVYEVTGDMLDAIPDTLAYDFDDGTPAGDRFGQMFGIHDTGLGKDREGFAAQGDSGSPIFIDGKIAGVVSFGEVDLAFGTYTVDVRVSSYVDWISSVLVGGGVEILVNQSMEGDQIWSSVGIDGEGNFVVTWTSMLTYAEPPVDPGEDGEEGEGEEGEEPAEPVAMIEVPIVMARRFDYLGNSVTDEFIVSEVSDYSQMYSQITMTPKGDFIIAWEGFYENPDRDFSSEIRAQRYVNLRDGYTRTPLDPENLALGYLYTMRPSVAGYGTLGENGAAGTNFSVNQDLSGEQHGVALASNSRGDTVFVWTGNFDPEGTGTKKDIYYNRATTKNDLAPPFVADAISVATDDNDDTVLTQILNYSVLDYVPNEFIFTFSEEMKNTVTNLSAWRLSYNGKQIANPFSSISFSRNEAKDVLGYESGKWEAIVELSAGLTLKPGVYTLTISGTASGSNPTMPRDMNNQYIDGDLDGRGGDAYTLTFYIGGDVFTDTEDEDPRFDDYDPPVFQNDYVGSSSNPAIASAADGTYAVVAIGPGAPNEDGVAQGNDIIIQYFNRYGEWLGPQTSVNSPLTNTVISNQGTPDISMDSYGTSVVVWTGNADGVRAGVFARVYMSTGTAFDLPFRVDLGYNASFNPSDAKVALQDDGTFLVTWIGDAAGYGRCVMGRVFDIYGNALSNGEVIIATPPNSNYNVVEYDIDCANVNGVNTYVVTWRESTTSSYQPILASIFTFKNDYSGINNVTNRVTISGGQTDAEPKVSFSGSGNGTIVVSWTDYSNMYSMEKADVYARCFNAKGAFISINGSTAPVRINSTTLHDQFSSDIGISQDGSTIVATWTSFDQEGENISKWDNSRLADNGVIARVFVWNGYSYVAEQEYLVNKSKNGKQQYSAVAVDANGDYTIVWTGPYVRPEDASTIPPNDREVNTFNRTVIRNTGDYDHPISPDPNDTSVVNWNNVEAEVVNLINRKQSQTGYIGKQAANSGISGANIGLSLPSVTKLEGTNGDDVFRFVAGSSTGSWKVYLNGKEVATIPANSAGIEFDGKGGNNKIEFVGTEGRDNVYVSMEDAYATFYGTGYSLTVRNFTSLDIKGNGGDDLIDVITSLDDDVVRMEVGALEIKSGSVIKILASSFETVVVTSGGGNDSVYLSDSAGNDHLELRKDSAVLSGDGFVHAANGFSNVNVSSLYGSDTAVIYGNGGNETLRGFESFLTLEGSAYTYKLDGFKSVDVYGNGGTDTGYISSYRGGSTFFGNGNKSSMLFGNGSFLALHGFGNLVVTVEGRDNIASITAGSNTLFRGEVGSASLYENNLYRELNGFDLITVDASKASYAIAELDLQNGGGREFTLTGTADSVVLSSGKRSDNLYELIAFDKVNADKNDSSKGTLLLEDSIDYLFASGEWE